MVPSHIRCSLPYVALPLDVYAVRKGRSGVISFWNADDEVPLLQFGMMDNFFGGIVPSDCTMDNDHIHMFP